MQPTISGHPAMPLEMCYPCLAPNFQAQLLPLFIGYVTHSQSFSVAVLSSFSSSFSVLLIFTFCLVFSLLHMSSALICSLDLNFLSTSPEPHPKQIFVIVFTPHMANLWLFYSANYSVCIC